MTNSTPKSNNRIERQASPSQQLKQAGKKSGGRSPHQIKTMTYFANGYSPVLAAAVAAATPNANNSRTKPSSAAARLSCSSPNNNSSCTPARNISRGSPMRTETPRGSPTNSFYAGAKFSEPPSPATLPKPPKHWTAMSHGGCDPDILTQHLRMLINVQA